MADSITEWRMTGLANSLDGRLGSTTQGLVVFMDFFADIDLPRTLTRGDEVRFPVAVYNYLPDAQTVQLDIEVGDWAELLTSATERVELGPGEVKGVRVGIRAKKVGWHPVKVTASSSAAEDALIRLVEVTPDGQPVRGSRSGRLDGTVAETVTFPEGAIEGTESLTVKLYPGVVAQAVEGLDSLLQMPSGCFEQTTATLWPNALVLDYMSTAGQITPEIELKAREFVSLGYQRLLTFECTGGGFTWFGDPAPANLILSAMGVLEFSDIAKVQDIDETLIPRTMQFLASKQSSDGSWHETQGSEFATVQYTDLMTTCFVTWALAEAGLDDASVKKGFDYAAQRLDDETPTYALALCANAFAWYNPQSSATAKALDDLASRAKHMEGDLVSWDAGVGGDGLYYGERGGGTSIETTALATLALLQGRSAPDLVGGALAFMASNKDSFGNWGTTHATILSLRAFVRSLTAVASEAAGTVTVSLGGTEHASIEVNEDNLDVFQQVDLYEHVVPAAENPVEIRFEGTGSLMYQIVWSHYVPGPPPSSPDEAISIEVSYDKTTLEVNDTVGVEATITNNTERPLPMVLVDLGLPPGFTVLTADLDKAVAERLIERYDLTARQVMVYLEKLESEPLVLTYGLQARYPLKVKAPDSSASLYYDPETKGSDEGEAFEVQE